MELAVSTHFSFLLVVQNLGLAALFVAVVGLLKEPTRQRAMAIMVGMAGGLFATPPFAEAGFLVGAVIAACGYFGLKSYPFIGLGWLLHAAWDTFRYSQDAGLVGQPPHASLGCAVFDPMIALWFFLGAPSVWRFARRGSFHPAAKS